ncbi:MAG: VWA domain-containing protein [Spartobacteria bacterium]|nr:VWA domain-containing protein [Spartobacteria bacterium]
MKMATRFGLVGMVASALLAGSVAVAQENVIVVSVLDYYEGLEGLGNATITIEQLLPAGGPPPMTDSIVFLPVPSNAVLKITANPVNVGSHQSFAYKWMGDVPESYVERNPPHPATILVSMGGEDKNIELLLSREYHPGEKKGDLDLDGLPDEWEVKYALDPEDATDVNNSTGDNSMPTGWNENKAPSGSYPAVPTLTSPYPNNGGSWYRGREPFTLWLECRGFDGWYGPNPVLANRNDDPKTDPRLLDTSGDGVPDGWQYWFFASALHNPTLEGVKLDVANYLDVNGPAPVLPIPNATIVNSFRPTSSLSQDLDDDCSSDGDKTDAANEYLSGSDPLHWDTDRDEIADGYEIRMKLSPTDSADANANSSSDFMAFAGDRRHSQVYEDLAFDPRTAWGENYLGRGTARELKPQENTVPFVNREKYKASIFLAVREGSPFSCARFNEVALDPHSIDTDGDGIFDGWELYVGLNPKNKDDGIAELDDDGLNNFMEFSSLDINKLRGATWPNGFTHFDATWLNKVWPTDPNAKDTDGDGMGDGAEGGYKDLEVPDGDTSGGSLGVLKYSGGAENWNNSCYVGGGMNPTSADTDGEGLPDPWEAVSYHISRTFDFAVQTNRNGMDPTVKDSNMDYDRDGLTNYQEYLSGATHHWRYTEWAPGAGLFGYDPMFFFTGTPYEWDWHLEINKCPFFYVPKYGDNTKVYYSSTNPRESDTDWDGMDDYWEIYHGLDPVFGVRDVHQSMILDAWVAVSEPASYDARIAPYGAGSPFADPDQDGLPNSEESLQANAATPYYYHTDPSPSWMTDISYQLSFVNLYYDLGSLALHWYFGNRLSPPSYMYSFADNEGFDTDHDMAGDRAEIVASQASPGSTDPLSAEVPLKRRALFLDGNAAARTRANFLHNVNDLNEFTVEAWVRSAQPAKGAMQVVVERPVKIPNGNIMGHPEGVRRNFRLALDADGKPLASYTGAGFDGLEYLDVEAKSSFALEADRWYHLAAVYDGAQRKLFLYVDGQMRGSIASTERPINGWTTGNPAWVFDAPLVVGAADRKPEGRVSGTPIWVGPGSILPIAEAPELDNFFEGWIDELRIWNDAKSMSEIVSSMNKPMGLQDVIESRQAALVVTTNPTPELMYLYNFDNLLDPNVEGIVPVGFNLLNGRPNDGSYPHVPWWGTAADKSLVYNNYNYVPWLVNLAARAPLDPPADSPLNLQMVTIFVTNVATSSTTTTNTDGAVETVVTSVTNVTAQVVQARKYPNTANPYNLGYYHASSFAAEHHPDFFQDEFTPVRSPLFNDLLPLRFARIDAQVELWDGAGSGTSEAYDTNEDGIPDWWETQHGFDPQGPSIAEEDPDHDGISNYWEYILETDPHGMYSLDPLMSDAAFDSDGDGINNFDEIWIWNTRPDKSDTDDDELEDGEEIEQNASALYSRSPLQGRSLKLDGTAILVPEPRKMKNGVMGAQRFEALNRWYVCAMVRPQTTTETGSLVKRTVGSSKIHFELGLENNAPFVRFTDINGREQKASGTAPLPTGQFSSLIAEWSPSNHVLRLLVDDCVVAAKNVFADCVKGRGTTTIGAGISGHVDDVYVGPDFLSRIPKPDYVLMMDVSGSMAAESRMEQAKEAGRVAVQNLPKGSQMAIIAFDHVVEGVVPFTNNTTKLLDFIDQLQPLGATSYSEPVTQMIALMTNRPPVSGGYIGILVSDGVPNAGVPSSADFTLVKELDAVVNTIGFGSTILAGGTYELERIAIGTGGNFYAAPSGDELADILEALLEPTVDHGFYPFDDGGATAEDYVHMRDVNFALANPDFDLNVFAETVTPFNNTFMDSEDELPDWWVEWFLKDSEQINENDDPDNDGLSNLAEWHITRMNQAAGGTAMNPMLQDSDGDGVLDGNEDHDGDSLINKDEENNHFSRADRTDTDDDGRGDSAELAAATKPAYSMIPYVMRAMRFGKTGGLGEVRVPDRVHGEDTEHLGAKVWTLECFVKPESVPAIGARHMLISRRLRCNGLLNYELGIQNNGSNQVVPYVRYNHFNDTNLVFLTTGTPLPVNEWSHLAARLADGKLTLFLNGAEVRAMNTGFGPAQGPGDVYFGGDGFRGWLRDVRIWKIGRSADAIRAFGERSLIFGLNAADSGLLRVVGDPQGHLREIAEPKKKIDQLDEWTLECWVRTTDTLSTRKDYGAGSFILRENQMPDYYDMGDDEDEQFESVNFNYFMGIDAAGHLVGKFSYNYEYDSWWGTYSTNTSGSATNSSTTNASDGVATWSYYESQLESGQLINDGKWHHVAYTKTYNDELRETCLYIDGHLAARQTLGEGILSEMYAGHIEIGRELDGDLDEVRIWNRPLGPAEIRNVMQQNLFGDEEGLVTYFSFDFQQGAFAADRALVRNPELEFGTYIPGARLVRTKDQAPIQDFYPLRVYAFQSLLGYFPADDGGTTMENLIYQNNWNYSGRLNGDVAFEELGYLDQPVNADSDDDGMPDWWETQMGLDPGSSRDENGAYGDPDHDGLSNWAEWLAGTSPLQFDTDGNGVGDFDSTVMGPTFGSLYMDGDHLPDEWEMLFSLDASHDADNPSIERFDDHDDPDGDGWDNLSEYLSSGYEFIDYTATIETNTGTSTTNFVRTFAPVESTNPRDAQSFPTPELTFTFLGKVTPPAGATLVLHAFSDPSMDRPDAVHTISNRFVNGLTEGVTLWNGGVTEGAGDGHVRQGTNVFMAFLDVNNDGRWNAGEWMGYSENRRENIQIGKHHVRMLLVDKPAGYIRFSWEQNMAAIQAALAQVNGTSYLVEILSLTEARTVFMQTNHLQSMHRPYITEMDLIQAGVPPMYRSYKWLVGTANGTVFASGTNYIDYPTALAKPVVQLPPQTIIYAQEKLKVKLDANTVQMHVRITNAASKQVLYNATNYVPYVDGAGYFEMNLPILAGYGSFTNNGLYGVQVRAINPRTNALGTAAKFGVQLRTAAQSGTPMISGKAKYVGWNAAAPIVVEAFVGSSFGQTPVAKVLADASFNYRLLGLPIGDYHVRAFRDHNANSLLDPGEGWGLVKAMRTDPSISATTPYASQYHSKRVEIRDVMDYVNNDLVIHDVDSDLDLLPDMWEYRYAGNLTAMNGGSDYNGDGLLDIVAFWNGTDPTKRDTDGDGLTDVWEIRYGLNPLSAVGADGAAGDPDGDGQTNAQEFAANTEPNRRLVPELTGGKLLKGGTHMALSYDVFGRVPVTVIVESADKLGASTWNVESRTTIYKAGAYTNTVPAGSGLHRKFFRVRFAD